MAETVTKPPFPGRLQVRMARYANRYWRRLIEADPVVPSIIVPADEVGAEGERSADLVAVVWGSWAYDGLATAEKLRLAYNAHDELVRYVAMLAERLGATRSEDPAGIDDVELALDARRFLALLAAGVPHGVVQDETPVDLPASTGGLSDGDA